MAQTLIGRTTGNWNSIPKLRDRFGVGHLPKELNPKTTSASWFPDLDSSDWNSSFPDKGSYQHKELRFLFKLDKANSKAEAFFAVTHRDIRYHRCCGAFQLARSALL